MENQFSKELFNWAEKVIECCTPIAKENNLEYYPLQSKAKINPEFLFIGLNPGGGYGYECQINNPKWEYDFNKKRLTSDRLLRGNPTFDKEFHAGKWKYGNGLKKINFLKNAIDNYDFCFTNYIYYSSKNFPQINKNDLKEAIEVNKQLTVNLIKILQPKYIIILGTGTGIDKIAKNTELILQGYSKRLLVKGEIEKFTVYGIPHPSYNNFEEENIAISQNLGELIQNKKLTNFEFKESTKSKKIHNNNFDRIVFEEHFSHYITDKNEKWCDIEIKDKMSLIRINFKDRVLGIRNIDSKKFLDLAKRNIYKSILKAPYEENQNSWAISKKINNYTDSSELVNEIQTLLKALKEN